ncbi:MAG: rhodanese-like domain-containing protein [Ignavibacteria bacterium]|jgi:rhodanese-related sulfurtransferase|nr:rhodanese-like domain-containing protein [Ignavibacteria bacterium]MDH7527977.1 rhodanese-like domain-containing protein [Ignavibacteria bacterium]
MKQLQKFLALLLVLILVSFTNGCKEKSSEPETPINEAQVLLEYLEGPGGDYINSTSCPAIISASDVYTYLQNNPSKIYIIDVRDSATFVNKGHIAGAHRVDIPKVLDHIKTLNTSNYDRIVIVCYAGQSAGYVTGLLRLMGYNNVYSLKYGMSSWHQVFAEGYWLANIGNSRASQFTTQTASKNQPGDLPSINTGKKTGPEILEARVKELLTAGWDPAKISHSGVFTNLSGYYIVNYWPVDHYNQGHIPGAVQYTPRSDLKSTTYLKTLPTNKPVVVYCYTGQTSAQVVAFLRVLGYDAKSLIYGTNAMIYDQMPGTRFNPNTDIMNYPYVTGQ